MLSVTLQYRWLGRISDADWSKTFAVNVTGPFIVADEAARILRTQDLPGSIVITTSVNAVVPKKGSFAYDASKAAANHLVRELAVALAPNIRVNGVAPATVVEGSSMFPRDRVVVSLDKYGITWSDDEIGSAKALYGVRAVNACDVDPRVRSCDCGFGVILLESELPG